MKFKLHVGIVIVHTRLFSHILVKFGYLTHMHMLGVQNTYLGLMVIGNH